MKRILSLLILLALLLSCLCMAQAVTYKTLKKGSRGEEVRKLQTALKEKGYYTMPPIRRRRFRCAFQIPGQSCSPPGL